MPTRRFDPLSAVRTPTEDGFDLLLTGTVFQDIIFTGRHVGAEEALEIGMADAVVPDEEVYATSVAMARKFAAGPPLALAAAAAALVLLLWGVAARRRARPAPVTEIPIDDFDAVLDAARNQVLADPRVAADVVKLWMRA